MMIRRTGVAIVVTALALCTRVGQGFLAGSRHVNWRTRLGSNGRENVHPLQSSRFPTDVIEALDLQPLMQIVASHTGTQRGRQALLDLVETDDLLDKKAKWRHFKQNNRKDRLQSLIYSDANTVPINRKLTLSIPTSATQAREQYDLTAQADLALQQLYGTTIPPIYGSTDANPLFPRSLMNDVVDDEWLELAPSEWTLEHLLQADKVVEMLLKVHEWSRLEETRTWLPLLANIVQDMPAGELSLLHSNLGNTVVVKKARTVNDPTGKSSFLFELNENKFPPLAILKRKLREMESSKGGASTKTLAEFQEDIEMKEQEILSSLAFSVLSKAKVINQYLNLIAMLDVIVAKAAYGMTVDGTIPDVGSSGSIDVVSFVHPLLLSTSKGNIIPVDLKLQSGNDNKKGLVISGPNGGGKTLALKSFGVAAVMCKLGVPLPQQLSRTVSNSSSRKRPRVDFFHNINVMVGDMQNVEEGTSTFLGTLNWYGKLFEVLPLTSDTNTRLILVDEMGGGTEAEAGGALAQAITEEILKYDNCPIVATTHVGKLKAMSYDNPLVDCAAVALKDVSAGKPTYELVYGIVGESYAIAAASRSNPVLPMHIIERAKTLLADSEETAGRIDILEVSLMRQIEQFTTRQAELDHVLDEAQTYRKAMLSLAASYDRHFATIEDRVNNAYKKARQSPDPVEVLGETVQEIVLAKKQVKSEAERLQERGLKLLPEQYDISTGETVVIVAKGEYDGISATVKHVEGRTVTVQPSFSPFQDVMLPELVQFGRHEIAIWDYDCIFNDMDDKRTTTSNIVVSIPAAKRKLQNTLSQLSNSSGSRYGKQTAHNTITSSRERKAIKKNKSAKKR